MANATDEKYKRARDIVAAYQKGGIYRAKDAMTQQNRDTELMFEYTAHLQSELDQLELQDGDSGGKIVAFTGIAPSDNSPEIAELQTKLDEAQETIMQLQLKLQGEGNSAETDELKQRLADAEAAAGTSENADIYDILKTTRVSLNSTKIELAGATTNIKALHEQLETARQELDKTMTELSSTKGALAAKETQLTEALDSANKSIGDRNTQIETLTDTITKLEFQLNEAKSAVPTAPAPLATPHSHEVYPREVSPTQLREILALVNQGRKIDALKLHREITGLGLKEAKDFIDKLVSSSEMQNAATLGVVSPDSIRFMHGGTEMTLTAWMNDVDNKLNGLGKYGVSEIQAIVPPKEVTGIVIADGTLDSMTLGVDPAVESGDTTSISIVDRMPEAVSQHLPEAVESVDEDEDEVDEAPELAVKATEPEDKKPKTGDWLFTSDLFKALGGDPKDTSSKVTFGGKTLTYKAFRQQENSFFTKAGLKVDTKRQSKKEPWLQR
jgi:ribosomal protein L7/L12